MRPTVSLRTSAHTGVAIRSPKRYVFNDTTNKMLTIRGCGLHHRHSRQSPRRGIAPPRNDMIDGASQLNAKLKFECQQHRIGRSGGIQYAPESRVGWRPVPPAKLIFELPRYRIGRKCWKRYNPSVTSCHRALRGTSCLRWCSAQRIKITMIASGNHTLSKRLPAKKTRRNGGSSHF